MYDKTILVPGGSLTHN